VGTNGGLSRLMGQRFFNYTSAHGLPSDGVSQILEDAAGRIWVGTNRGVAALSRASLDAVAAGRSLGLEVELFGRSDGLESPLCTAPAQGYAARDGRLWFPTRRGLAVVDPAAPRAELAAPQVVLEGLEVDDRPVRLDAPLPELPPGTGRLAFRFSAPELLVPGRVRFRYRLEGYDEDWVEAGGRRVAYYTGVPPGRYTFRVMAGLLGGPWRDEGTRLPLVLLPRFHQTRAFLVTCALLVGLVLVSAYRLRIRSLARRERQLLALVQERTRSLAEEKERAEAAAREADRQKRVAQEAAALKTEFLGIAAHDLKNPLVAVRGFSEILAAGNAPPTKVVELSERMGQSADRMLALIDDLLTTAASEGSQGMLQRTSAELGALVGLALEELRPLAARKQQSLRLKVEEGCRAEVDQGRIREVVENLVANAIKYSPAGSSIRVEVARGEGRVHISVADQGPGLKAEDWPRLFQPFVRLSARPTGGETSTGLGLSIVKRLVELHGGRVWAQSPGEGQGTTFHVDLPVTVPPVSPASALD
jgi:signal transduction histidine kinase